MSNDTIDELLADSPNNWGRWGDDDELGAINYLDADQVLRGIRAVEDGKVFALGTPIGHPGGDPRPPGEAEASHHMTIDHGHYLSGKVEADPTGLQWSGDVIDLPVHGTTTHVDSPGHTWYDGQLYNGFDGESTIHGLARCGIEHVAEHGIVGRGVLLDIAAHRDVEYLERGSPVTVDELRSCAEEQGVEIERNDVLLVRTGAMGLFYREGRDAYEAEYFEDTADGPAVREPGPTYTPALVEWLDDREIPFIGVDTIMGEQTKTSETGASHLLHPALIRDMGVLLAELYQLEPLATYCGEEGKYDFLHLCSPLKIVGGSGSPVNPIAIV